MFYIVGRCYVQCSALLDCIISSYSFYQLKSTVDLAKENAHLVVLHPTFLCDWTIPDLLHMKETYWLDRQVGFCVEG